MEYQGTLNSQNNLEKYKVGGLTLPDFKSYYKATMYIHMKQDRYINGIERKPKSKSSYDLTMFDKGANTIQ